MANRGLNEQMIMYRVYQLGERLRSYEMDEDEQASIGDELIALSGICRHCDGSGMDGDPPDAAGVGGGEWPCDRCNGSGQVPQPDLTSEQF